MQSTLEPKLSDDPHDFLVVAPDVVLVAPTDEELSRLARSMRHAFESAVRTSRISPPVPAVPPVDTTFRAVPSTVGHRPSIGARAIRGFIGFLLALCIGVAAAAWQAYGDAAKQMVAEWAPQFVLTSGRRRKIRRSPSNRAHPPLKHPQNKQHLCNRLPRRAPYRPQPLSLPDRRRRCSRWRAISQPQNNRSSSSRPASNSSRPARNKCRAMLPKPLTPKRLRAEPAAQDIGASAPAGRRAGAQTAVVQALSSRGNSDVAADRRTLCAAAA